LLFFGARIVLNPQRVASQIRILIKPTPSGLTQPLRVGTTRTPVKLGHCDGTPHSCGSGPAQLNILLDKSGVPAETMRLDFLQYQGATGRDCAPVEPAIRTLALRTVCLLRCFAKERVNILRANALSRQTG
jgi:hypothetical protein